MKGIYFRSRVHNFAAQGWAGVSSLGRGVLRYCANYNRAVTIGLSWHERVRLLLSDGIALPPSGFIFANFDASFTLCCFSTLIRSQRIFEQTCGNETDHGRRDKTIS